MPARSGACRPTPTSSSATTPSTMRSTRTRSATSSRSAAACRTSSGEARPEPDGADVGGVREAGGDRLHHDGVAQAVGGRRRAAGGHDLARRHRHPVLPQEPLAGSLVEQDGVPRAGAGGSQEAAGPTGWRTGPTARAARTAARASPSPCSGATPAATRRSPRRSGRFSGSDPTTAVRAPVTVLRGEPGLERGVVRRAVAPVVARLVQQQQVQVGGGRLQGGEAAGLRGPVVPDLGVVVERVADHDPVAEHLAGAGRPAPGTAAAARPRPRPRGPRAARPRRLNSWPT